MKLLVYEWICAGGFGENPPSSLRAEGGAMLRAAAGDFATIADTSALLTFDMPEIPGIRCERTSVRDASSRFQQLIREHDAVLPIAPESGDVLGRIAETIWNERRILLGCDPAAVRLTADKFALAEFWRECGVPSPQTRLLTADVPAEFPVVIKPRDGAGSQAMRLVSSSEAWPQMSAEVRSEMPAAEFLVQPFRCGRACSVGFLIGQRQIVPLLPAEQLLSATENFAYRGGRMPLEGDLARRALKVASAAIAGIDGLAGYVGVDLILGDDGRDEAIEINPRVTTSYVGYRKLCADNLAHAWLHLAEGASDVKLSWRPGSVSFSV